MPDSEPEDTKWERRGRAAVVLVALLVVVVLIAVGSGWLGGMIEGNDTPITTDRSINGS